MAIEKTILTIEGDEKSYHRISNIIPDIDNDCITIHIKTYTDRQARENSSPLKDYDDCKCFVLDKTKLNFMPILHYGYELLKSDTKYADATDV